MKSASVADVEAHFKELLKAAAAGPVVVRRKGRAVAAIVAIADEEEAEQLLMAHSPRLQAIVAKSRKEIRAGDVLSHEEFWAKVESSRKTNGSGRKKKDA